MAVERATSEYVLVDRATPQMRDMREEAVRARGEFVATAKALDKIGTPQQRQRLEALDGRLTRVGKSAEKMAGALTVSASRADDALDKIGRAGERADARMTVSADGIGDSMSRSADRVDVAADRILTRLVEIGTAKPRPKVEMEGVGEALAEVKLLKAQLGSLDRTSATARVRVAASGGGGGAARTAAGAAAGGSGGIISGGVGPLNLSPRATLATYAAALPLVQTLGASTVGLAGSLTGAGLGAGGIGLAGGGALTAGIVSLVSVVKPAMAGLKDLQKAEENYQGVVAQYGQGSDQAVEALRKLRVAQRAAPEGGRELLEQTQALGREWKTATREAQGYLTTLGASAIRRFRSRAEDQMAGNATTVARATQQQGLALTDYLTSSSTQNDLTYFSNAFADNLDEAEGALENVLGTLQHLARAGTPFFHEGMTFVERWTGGLERSTSDISSTRRTMGEFVDDLRDWKDLAGAALDVTKDLLGAARPSGDSLVESLTGQLETWDRWLDRNPDRATQFFDDAADSTRSLATDLKDAVRFLNQMATELRPILTQFGHLVGLASQLGLIGTPGALAAVVGGAKALRGGAGAGGAGAAAAAGGAGILGVGGGAAGAAAGGGASLAATAGVSYLAMRGAGRPGARSLAGAVTPEEFSQRYGTVEGARYAAPASQLGARTRGLGSLAERGRGVARGAFKGAAPIVAGLAALDFASTQGSVSDRAQAATADLTFGLTSRPLTGAERTDRASRDAQGTISRLTRGLPQTVGGSSEALRRIDAEIARQRPMTRRTTGSFLGMENTGLLTSRGKVTAAEAAEAKTRVDLLQQERDALAGTNREMRAQQNVRLNAQSRERGGNLASSFQRGFEILAPKEGQEKAMDETVSGVLTKMRGMRREGARVIAENTLAWARQQAKSNPELRDQVDRLTKGIESRFSRMGDRVSVVNGRIVTGSATQWRQIQQNISTPAEQAREKVTTAFTAIQEQAIGALVAMGYSRNDAKGMTQGAEDVSAASGGKVTGAAAADAGRGAYASGQRYAAQAAASKKRNARGGRVPGVGLQDTVPVGPNALAAPGELWFANRHTEQRVDGMLRGFGTTLHREILGENRPHSAPMQSDGASLGGRFALGGNLTGRAGSARAAGAGGGASGLRSQVPLGGVHPSVLAAARRVEQQFPALIITSGTGGGHAANSLHYTGQAVDIGGDVATMHRAAAWIKSTMGTSLAEGIHNPNLSVKNGASVPPSFWGGTTWAAHANHIHLGVLDGQIGGARGIGGGGDLGAANGSAGMPTGEVSLRTPRSGLRGAPGAVADQASRLYATALQRRVNARLRADAGSGLTGGGATPRGGAAAPAQVRRWVVAGMRLAGIPTTPANIAAQVRLTMGESGGNPTIRQQIHDVNSTNGSGGAIGFAQMLQSTFDAYALPGHRNILNPVDNTASSVRYQMAKYGHLVGHAGYAYGGRLKGGGVPWMRSGGEVVARRPTLVGVGDHPGGEVLSVRRRDTGPKRAGRGRGGLTVQGPLMSVGKIEHHAKGDAGKAMMAELESVLATLREALDLDPDEDEQEVLR